MSTIIATAVVIALIAVAIWLGPGDGPKPPKGTALA